MIFHNLDIPGAYLLEQQKHEDERGYFARTFCSSEFRNAGIYFSPVQSNISHNKKAFTLRGLHFHKPPNQEEKLVSCIQGRIFDVIVDLRENTPTFGAWFGSELSSSNGKSLFIPKGCAHGFITLEDHSDVFYQMSPAYVPGFEAGICWDDPKLNISWPASPVVISEKDLALPSFKDLVGV